MSSRHILCSVTLKLKTSYFLLSILTVHVLLIPYRNNIDCPDPIKVVKIHWQNNILGLNPGHKYHCANGYFCCAYISGTEAQNRMWQLTPELPPRVSQPKALYFHNPMRRKQEMPPQAGMWECHRDRRCREIPEIPALWLLARDASCHPPLNAPPPPLDLLLPPAVGLGQSFGEVSDGAIWRRVSVIRYTRCSAAIGPGATFTCAEWKGRHAFLLRNALWAAGRRTLREGSPVGV